MRKSEGFCWVTVNPGESPRFFNLAIFMFTLSSSIFFKICNNFAVSTNEDKIMEAKKNKLSKHLFQNVNVESNCWHAKAKLQTILSITASKYHVFTILGQNWNWIKKKSDISAKGFIYASWGRYSDQTWRYDSVRRSEALSFISFTFSNSLHDINKILRLFRILRSSCIGKFIPKSVGEATIGIHSGTFWLSASILA